MKKLFIAFGAIAITAATVLATRGSMRKVPPTGLYVQKVGVCKAIASCVTFCAATRFTTTNTGNPQAKMSTATSGATCYPLFQSQTSAAVCNTPVYIKP